MNWIPEEVFNQTPEVFKEGDLRVSYMRNWRFSHKRVSSVEEAISIINKQAKIDLRPASRVTDNSFSMEVYEDVGEGFGWYNYYNEDGMDIDEIMDYEEESKEDNHG